MARDHDDVPEKVLGANPKHDEGRKKPGMSLAPATAAYWWGYVHEAGAEKYGAFNWRETRVYASVYIDAMRRHADLMAEGEFFDTGPDGTGAPHAACIMACAAILIDAFYHDTLVDDTGWNRNELRRAMGDIAELRADRGFSKKDVVLTRGSKINARMEQEEGPGPETKGPRTRYPNDTVR